MNSDVKVSNFRPNTEKIARELRKIDQSGFKTLEKIKNLRHQLRTKIHFQQKMSQVTLQIRWQSVIVSILFVALIAFSWVNYGWQQVHIWLVISVVLFAIGIIFNWFIGRGFKWNL
jgi:hypothetical protein